MEKRIRFRFGKLGKNPSLNLLEYIEKVLGTNPTDYFKLPLYYICLNDLCIVHEKSGKIDGVSLIYTGNWIGVLVGDDVYLSPQLYEKIYSRTGYRAAIVVSEKGIKNFLYGKDVLEESVLKKYPPLDNPVAVIDSYDNRVVGVAIPIRERRIYKNVYDLGIFLRRLG
ncbi:MAG: hypothetical protein ABWW65_05045 [Thermoprotei archaeon]